MKLAKILMAALVVMMVFAVAPLASAEEAPVCYCTENHLVGCACDCLKGECPCNPYLVRYVGYEYDFGSFNYYDMVGSAELPVINSAVISDITSNTVYYTTYYSAIDYDVNYLPVPASLNAAATDVSNSGACDILITDMAFSGYSYDNNGPIDTARANFYNACDASTITNKASIYSDDFTDSYAPLSFNYRDSLNYPNTYSNPFTDDMDDGLTAIGYGSTLADYEELLSYLN